MSHPIEHSSAEHGKLSSYVVGFGLSLVLTLIPYYIVVNQLIVGQSLQITILGFAVLQLLVQVVFFLHLGLGPKPRWNVYFLVGTIATILIVVAGSIVITNNLHYNMASEDQAKRLVDSEGIYQVGGELTGACQGQHTVHRVTIKGGKIDPLVTVASKCDKLIFTEAGGTTAEIVIGSAEKPAVYAGQTKLELRKDRTRTLNLSQTGTYQFHIEEDPEVIGTFAVYDN